MISSFVIRRGTQPKRAAAKTSTASAIRTRPTMIGLQCEVETCSAPRNDSYLETLSERKCRYEWAIRRSSGLRLSTIILYPLKFRQLQVLALEHFDLLDGHAAGGSVFLIVQQIIDLGARLADACTAEPGHAVIGARLLHVVRPRRVGFRLAQ